MDLEDSDLVEMGFTKGQRMKIVKIIQSIKVRKSILNQWTNFMEQHCVGKQKRTVLVRIKRAASKPVQTVKATSGAPGTKCSIESV